MKKIIKLAYLTYISLVVLFLVPLGLIITVIEVDRDVREPLGDACMMTLGLRCVELFGV